MRKLTPNEEGFIAYMRALPAPEPPKIYVFRGWLDEEPDSYGDAFDPNMIVWLRRRGDTDRPLVELVESELDKVAYQRPWSVRYYLADRELRAEWLTEAFLRRSIMGDGYATYWEGSVAYSEWTPGTLTYQEFQVGGHDLVEELRTHIGKFLHLEIVVS